MVAMMGARIPPNLPKVEHRPMQIPRTLVGNSSDVIMLMVTVCMAMKYLPINEQAITAAVTSDVNQ